MDMDTKEITSAPKPTRVAQKAAEDEINASYQRYKA
jgi:hypothetical protein